MSTSSLSLFPHVQNKKLLIQSLLYASYLAKISIDDKPMCQYYFQKILNYRPEARTAFVMPLKLSPGPFSAWQFTIINAFISSSVNSLGLSTS